MGSCIICGTSVDGEVCASHEEDVAFEFRGSRAKQLTSGRFYRGTVDGYADFGVFVNIGDAVTGLLHRSKLDQRLESLSWEPGDTVFVQVTNVRDNGDVDLGWSIRQDEREFRGTLIDDPSGDQLPDEADEEPAPAPTAADEPADSSAKSGPAPTPQPAGAGRTDERGESRGTADGGPGGSLEPTNTPSADPDDTEEPAADMDPTAVTRVPVGDLEEYVDEHVRLEGQIIDLRQTGGPTVFELRDESGTVDCAAFVEAGVRAYPEVEVGDIVRLVGEVRTRREELQVETETLSVLADTERSTVENRLDEALTARAEPDTVELLAPDEALDTEAIEDVATEIRRALLSTRPVVVRHPATADGYIAGAAIERAALPILDEEHEESDAPYHYFERRPLEGPVYDMDDATRDLTSMLDDRERHGEQVPLFVFVGTGTGGDSRDGLQLLDIYDAPMAIISGTPPDAEITTEVDAAVAPSSLRTAATVAASVAAAVNPAVTTDLAHLPATSYWEDPPAAYLDLASEAGFDETTLRELRQAIAIEAFYQSYEDKRELIIDLLFDELDAGDGRGLAAQVSEQFRTKVDAELETATANVDRREIGGTTVAVLDTEAYTHQYDFPPVDLLLDELHRRLRPDVDVTVGVGTDVIRLRRSDRVDLEAIVETARSAVPTASIDVRGTHIEFLAGKRDAVVEAVVEGIAAEG